MGTHIYTDIMYREGGERERGGMGGQGVGGLGSGEGRKVKRDKRG